MKSNSTGIETTRFARARRSASVMSFFLLCGAFGQIGCESADAKACRDDYLKAHSLLGSVDNKSIDSLQPTLDAVENAITLCKKANLAKELAELEKVQKTLQANADLLRTNGSRKDLSPEELDKLVKDGDPNCPKGQSYNYKKTTKQVRCTGPQLVAFSRGQAEEYFKNRGFRVKSEGTHLDAELGPQSYSYEFTSSESSAKARCLKVRATPGMSWEESAARVTGAHPMRLKKGQTVQAEDGSKWPLAHTDDEKQAVYTLGKCSE